MAENPVIRLNNRELGEDIQRMLLNSGIDVDLNIIRLIMKHQEQHLENVGIIRIVYRNDL